MDSNINNGLRAHAFIESFKTEVLSTCTDLLKKTEHQFTGDIEAFILDTVDEFVVKFNTTKSFNVDSYQLQLTLDDNIEDDVLFIKVDDAQDIFNDFRSRFNTVLLQLVLCKLELFLITKGE